MIQVTRYLPKKVPSPGQLKTCQRVLFPLPHTWVAADWELFGDNCKAERCLVWIIFSNDELKALKAFETIKYVKCSLACKVVSHQ